MRAYRARFPARGWNGCRRCSNEKKPALLILCHGANDLLRFLDKRRVAANLRAMIRLAREKRVAVVIIAVPASGIALSPPTFYREIAAEMKIPIEEETLIMVLSDSFLKHIKIFPNHIFVLGYTEDQIGFMARNKPDELFHDCGEMRLFLLFYPIFVVFIKNQNRWCSP